MVETQEITKAEFLTFYAEGKLFDYVNTGNRIYARTKAELHGTYKTVVYCVV